jgi:hypothetical protein
VYPVLLYEAPRAKRRVWAFFEKKSKISVSISIKVIWPKTSFQIFGVTHREKKSRGRWSTP